MIASRSVSLPTFSKRCSTSQILNSILLISERSQTPFVIFLSFFTTQQTSPNLQSNTIRTHFGLSFPTTSHIPSDKAFLLTFYAHLQTCIWLLSYTIAYGIRHPASACSPARSHVPLTLPPEASSLKTRTIQTYFKTSSHFSPELLPFFLPNAVGITNIYHIMVNP